MKNITNIMITYSFAPKANIMSETITDNLWNRIVLFEAYSKLVIWSISGSKYLAVWERVNSNQANRGG